MKKIWKRMKAMVTEKRMEVEGWATEAAMAMEEKMQTLREETVAGMKMEEDGEGEGIAGAEAMKEVAEDGEEAVAEEAGIVEMVGMVVTKWGVIVAHVASFVRECLRTCVSLPSLMDIYYVTSFPG